MNISIENFHGWDLVNFYLALDVRFFVKRVTGPNLSIGLIVVILTLDRATWDSSHSCACN